MLWAKLGGGVDYEQRHHRDFGNHSLVVPKRPDPGTQLTSFVLLSDVGEEDGPTKVVPLPVGESVDYWPSSLHEGSSDFVADSLPAGAFAEEEISVTGPAGTLFSYRTDILHRGSRMAAKHSARFTPSAHYDVWGRAGPAGRGGPPTRSISVGSNSSSGPLPRERSVFGFPSPGDPYWDA